MSRPPVTFAVTLSATHVHLSNFYIFMPLLQLLESGFKMQRPLQTLGVTVGE